MKNSSYSDNLNLSAPSTKKVIEIGAYYLHLIAALKRSRRLNAEEKLGQLAFLVREWERY